MEMTTSVLGSCALAAVAVLARFAQDRLDRRQASVLEVVKHQSCSLAASVRKNGGLKSRK